ncbi:MAG: hypothetical protein RBR53_08385 [Desulforegulaceae bacterium]|nr:hypothetical protein [Desulforegulaceae bacterium]
MKKKQTDKIISKKKSKAKKILFIIFTLILSLIIAGGITWYIYIEKDRFKPKTHEFFEFPLKTQTFFYKNYPKLISLVDSIDNELEKVKKEAQRIEKLEKDYPGQKNITERALLKLEKIQTDSKNEMDKIINDLNNIFVRANLGSAPFEENFINDTKIAEEKLDSLQNKISRESKPYKSDKKEPQSILENIKSYFHLN